MGLSDDLSTILMVREDQISFSFLMGEKKKKKKRKAKLKTRLVTMGVFSEEKRRDTVVYEWVTH